jgi:hypothetical protein
MGGTRHAAGGAKTGGAALALLMLALALRLLVPAGFMPVSGQGYMVTLCTGSGAIRAFVDERGEGRDGSPASRPGFEQPCSFAGLATALDLPPAAASVVPALAFGPAAAMLMTVVAIGRGLAAPPPPPTGPPARP